MKTDILILFVLFMLATGCSDKDQDTKPSLPTMGELVIGIDESLRPVTDAEIATFSVYYPNSRITPLYLPEKQVIEKLLSNEIQTGIICRDLYNEEVDFIKNTYTHSVTTIKLANDKIEAVVNNVNPLNSISHDEIVKILSGKITKWIQLNPASNDESPIVVVITGSSSIDRYFSSSADPLSPVSTYGLDTTTEVIDYVKNNASAIGIVGGSWFYQKGNKNPDIKLLAYSEGNQKTENQELIFLREVYAVTHEPFTGLGSGFISFMAGQKGQLIILKAGMTPYKSIEREIEISDSYQNW